MKILGIVPMKDKIEILYVKNIDNDRYVYYLGDRLIGGYDKDVSMQKIIFKENSKENELSAETRDIISNILEQTSLEEIQKTAKDLEKEDVENIEKLLELNEEEKISRIVETDLEEKEEKEKKKEFSTEDDVTVKQEMKFNDKITDMKTLGQLLQKEGKIPNIKGKKFDKMGIIESTSMNEMANERGNSAKVNTTRYSFVAIATDGTIVPMDLEQDYQEGNNPREMNYQVKQNGTVEKDDVLSRFKIGEGTFSVKNGQYGELKVYHSPRKTLGGEGIEGNKSLDREIETQNVWELKKEERDLAGEYKDGYRSVEDGYQEIEKLEKENDKEECDKLRTADVDGEKLTKSHEHYEEFIQRETDRLMEIYSISEVFTRKEVEETLKKAKNNNKEKLTDEQIAKKVEIALEQDASIYTREK